MALDIVIMDGDVVEFLPIKGVQFLNPKLQKNIKASGKTTINGKRVCVERDEKSVEIPCDYTTSIFSQPGKGTLSIKELKPGQLTQKTKCGRKKVILKGQTFVSEFKVTVARENGTTSQYSRPHTSISRYSAIYNKQQEH